MEICSPVSSVYNSPTRSLKSLKECLLITSSFPTKAKANSTMVPMCMYCLSCSWKTAGNRSLRGFPDHSLAEAIQLSQLAHLWCVLRSGWCIKPSGSHISAANCLNLFHATEFWLGQQLHTNTTSWEVKTKLFSSYPDSSKWEGFFVFTSSKSAMISLRSLRHSNPSLLTSDSV